MSGGAPGAPVPLAQPTLYGGGQQLQLADVLARLTPLQWGTLGGLGVALLTLALPWAKISAFGESQTGKGWKKGAWQFADWLGTEGLPLEAIIVLISVGVGVLLVLGPLLGRTMPSFAFETVVPLAAIPGAALTLLGIINYLYIDSKFGEVRGVAGDAGIDLSIGMGVYLLILAGAASAICAFMNQKRLQAR